MTKRPPGGDGSRPRRGDGKRPRVGPGSQEQRWLTAKGSTWSREQAIMVRRLRAMGVSYSDYLDGAHWRALVKSWRVRNCEACGSGLGVCLHHVTYARLGRERVEDLCTLCARCHRAVHEAAAAGTSSLDPRPSVVRQLSNKPQKVKKPRRKRFAPEELFEDCSTREWNRHRKVVEPKLTPEQRQELRRLVDQARRED